MVAPEPPKGVRCQLAQQRQNMRPRWSQGRSALGSRCSNVGAGGSLGAMLDILVAFLRFCRILTRCRFTPKRSNVTPVQWDAARRNAMFFCLRFLELGKVAQTFHLCSGERFGSYFSCFFGLCEIAQTLRLCSVVHQKQVQIGGSTTETGGVCGACG